MHELRLFIRTTINESRKLESDARLITQKIINTLAKTKLNSLFTPDLLKKAREHLKEPQVVLDIEVNSKVLDKEIKLVKCQITIDKYEPVIRVGGWFNYKTSEISLEISIPDQKFNNEELYFKVLNIIRHELEHLQQSIAGERKKGIAIDLDSSEQNMLDYYTSPDEIEAYAVAAYLNAKKERTTVSVQLEKQRNEIINSLDSMNLMSSLENDKTIEKIADKAINTYVDYIKKRFKNAKF